MTDQAPAPATPATIRPAAAADRPFIDALFTREFASHLITSRGRIFDTRALPALVAERHGEPLGVAAYHLDATECELVALACHSRGGGVGSLLLEAVADTARAAGRQRLFLTTSNDNLDAMRFYQRRGMRLAAVHPGSIERTRAQIPSIPLLGHYGIPIRDDVEFEIAFTPRSHP